MEIFTNPQKFRVNILQQNPLKTHNFHFIFLLIFALTLDSAKSTSIQPRFLQIPYSQYCNDVVTESPSAQRTNLTLEFADAIFAGGTEILRNQNNQPAGRGPVGVVSFRSQLVYKTQIDQVFKLEGRLVLKGRRDFLVNRRQLRMVSYRPPRIPVRPSQAAFRLHGFWSAASGKLCMVGSGVSYLRTVNVVLKLDYPNFSNISSSFVNGTLGNLGHMGDLNYFKPIEILGVSLRGYNFTLIENEKRNGVFSSVYDEVKNMSLGFETSREVCSVIRYAGKVELDYLEDCGAVNCKFLGDGSEVLPTSMTLDEVECLENGRVRYLLRFTESSLHSPFDPSTTLVAEGAWDGERKSLDLVACRIVNATESLSKSSVGDCSIRLILRVPSSFSLRNRSIIVGQIWSKTMLNDSSSFGRVSFRSQGNKHPRFVALKYKYGEYDNARKTCVKEIKVKRKGRVYPDGNSSDMRFDMTVRNKKGRAWGYSSPLSVGDKFYDPLQVLGKQTELVTGGNQTQSSILNISYVLSFKNDPGFKLGGEVPPKQPVQISAEGIYDAKTGFLCMIGCRHLASHDGIQHNTSLDCDIVVIAEFPPLNSKDGGNVKGIIQSTRSKADPHYFDALEFHSNSVYTYRAKQSIWRMDLEITMVLISSTLACIFVGLQLFYVHKHPDVLPSSSIVMLVILTLGHMIPLLLNFEAVFFSNHRRQALLTGNDGWLEVTEVLVRVITMIVFLMELRLLQLSWSARVGDESQNNLWVYDKKVLYLSLPLYIGGGLIAWFVHLLIKPYPNALRSNFNFANSKGISFWGELKSYAGLILDGFLLPQIIFNFFCDSKEKALAPSFYIGTTLLRLLPHAYDLYRTHSSSWSFTYIYANPGMDYYSTVWDIIICCCGGLFVFIIFLQQWFGGRFFLPQRYREISSYEKVPVAGTE